MRDVDGVANDIGGASLALRSLGHESIMGVGRKGCEMDGDASSAKRYRARAAEVRGAAEKMTSLETREMLLSIAANYERLASRIEASARQSRR